MNLHRPIPLAITHTAAQMPIANEHARLWTSCLTSNPGSTRPVADLMRPKTDRTPPVFSVTGLLLGTWNPARAPIIRFSRNYPMHREPTPGPLRNGNPRGNPNAAAPP